MGDQNLLELLGGDTVPIHESSHGPVDVHDNEKVVINVGVQITPELLERLLTEGISKKS